MIGAVNAYFARLSSAFGEGWTRFWFTPSDPTTLSAMRLLVGLVAVYLHATLLFDLVPFFGPNGLLPVREIAPLEGGTFSYLNYLSTPAELYTIHLLGLAILLAFALGLWTRLTAVLSLIVFLSDVQRAPMITGRTEPLVAMMLAYLCLAPCGRRFSIDSLLATSPSGPLDPDAQLSTSATIATRLIQIHLALWIAMMGFSKLTGETWWTGSGVWWLIARRESRLVDLSWLHATPTLIDLWTHAVVLFELAFPILVWNRLARPLMLALAVVIWSSLALITGDITFAVTLMIAAIAFIPPETVRAAADRLSWPKRARA